MPYNFTEKCPNCGVLVAIVEYPMGVPGGKEREEANCPNCGETLFSAMTDGWFSTEVVSEKQNEERF